MLSRQNGGRERLTALTYVAIIAGLGLFYIAISYLSHQSFTWRNGGWYGELAQSFLQGKVSLLSQPSPGLLADPHPYSGVYDFPIKWDISYYHGTYYLYFGPAPAVLLFYPWLLLTGQVLNQALAFWLLCMTGLILFGLLLHGFVRIYYPSAALWLQSLILLLFGLENCQGAIIHFVQMYGLASMSGAVLTLAMFYAIFLAMHDPRVLLPGLAAASFFWAASICSRPTFIFEGLIFLPLLYRLSRKWTHGRFLQACLVTVLPAVPVGMALAWYNYARFGNPLDFGINYQIARGIDYTANPRFSPFYFPAGALEYLITPWRLSTDFPFLFPDPYFRGPLKLRGDHFMGLLFAAPVFFYGALWPRVVKPPQLRWFSFLLSLSALVMFVSLASFVGIHYPYFLDFQMALSLLMAITLLAYEKNLAESPAKRRFFGCVVAYSLYLGFALAMIGEINGIHTYQTYPPTAYGEPWLPDGEKTQPREQLKN